MSTVRWSYDHHYKCTYCAVKEEFTGIISKIKRQKLQDSSACCGDVIGLMEKMTKKQQAEEYMKGKKKSVHKCMCSSYIIE